MAASVNSNCAPLGPRRRNRPSRRMRFRCAKQHLDLFAIAARLRERLRLGESAGDVARGLVHIADDPPRWHVRAALCLQWTCATLRHGDQIAEAGDRRLLLVVALREIWPQLSKTMRPDAGPMSQSGQGLFGRLLPGASTLFAALQR